MSEIITFDSMADRLAYVRGKHTEIEPKEVIPKMQMQEADEIVKDEPVVEEPKEEPKPKKKTAAKKKTTKKKKGEDDAVQTD